MTARWAVAVLLCGTALLAAQASELPDTVATIDNFTFAPETLEVVVGTRVVWTNRDDLPHTVTDSDNPRTVRSPALDTGDSYARTFLAAGTYKYFCSLHPHMQGTVVVK